MFTGVPVDLSLAPEEIKDEVVQLANNRRPKRAPPRCRDIADRFLIRKPGRTFV